VSDDYEALPATQPLLPTPVGPISGRVVDLLGGAWTGSTTFQPTGDVDPFRHLKRAIKPLFAAPEGAVFSLALRGKLVTTAAGTATLDISRVRQYPGGHWLDIDERTVELAIPLGTELERDERPDGVLVHARIPRSLVHRFAEFEVDAA